MRSLVDRWRNSFGPRFGDDGVGLIEVVIAFTILSVVLIPVANLIETTINQSANAQQRVAALSVAESTIEALDANGPYAYPPLVNSNNLPIVCTSSGSCLPTQVAQVTLSNTSYTAYVAQYWANAGSGTAMTQTPNLCSSTVVPVLNEQVTVTWPPNQNKASPLSSENQLSESTIITYPPKFVAPNADQLGYFGVQLTTLDASATDVNGVPWSLSLGQSQATPVPNARVADIQVVATSTQGSTTYTENPNPVTGCAFFAVPPGTYTVTVENLNSLLTTQKFVNTGFALSQTSAQFTVNAGQEDPVISFTYDEGGYIGLSYPTSTDVEDGVSCPNATGIDCLALGESQSSSSTPNTGGQAALAVESSSGTWSPATITPISGQPSSMPLRITQVSCGSSFCVGIAYTSGGTWESVSASEATPTGWVVSALPTSPTVTSLSQLVCAPGSSNICYMEGVGTGGTYIFQGTASTSGVTWSNSTPTVTGSITAINQLLCDGSVECFALGTDGATSTDLMLHTCLPTANGGCSTSGWVQDAGTSFPSSGSYALTSFTQMACPSTTVCVAIGTATHSGSTQPWILAGSVAATSTDTGAVTWNENTPPTNFPSNVSSLSQIVCGNGTGSAEGCYAVGTNASTTDPEILGAPAVAGSQTWQSWTGSSLASLTSLNQLVCPSATVCVLSGATSTADALVSAAITNPATTTDVTFNADTVPAGLNNLAQLTCETSGSACMVLGSTSSGDEILTANSSSSSAWSWSTSTPPLNVNPAYYTGVACGTSFCAASGATTTGALLLDGTSTFSNATPSGMPGGMYANGVPITIGNSELLSGIPDVIDPNTSSAATPTDPPMIGYSTATSQGQLLFPFSNGYTVYPGDCSPTSGYSDDTESTLANIVPGQGAPTPPLAAPLTDAVPLGLLPIEVLNTSGLVPVSPATVSIELDNSGCSSDNDKYTLQAADVEGLSRVSVIYETYTLSVTGLGNTETATVQVTPSTVIVTGGSTSESSLGVLNGTYDVPQPIKVVV